jgi:hypothetical protein
MLHGLQGEVRREMLDFTVINFRAISWYHSRATLTDHCHEGSSRLLSSRGL